MRMHVLEVWGCSSQWTIHDRDQRTTRRSPKMSRWPYVQTPQPSAEGEQHYKPIPAYAISADEHARVLGSDRVLLRRVCRVRGESSLNGSQIDAAAMR